MDIATITGAYQGLKTTKEILTGLFDAKVDAESKPKILEAQAHLGEVQDTLFTLRDELFKLQEEGNKLRQLLDQANAWESQIEKYDLVETAGGAIVYKSKTQPEHFACPSCFNKKEIHILQNNRTMSGKYRCTGCTNQFPIEPRERINMPPPTNNSW